MTAIIWSDGAPIYRQLKERVVAMMLDGVLKPGDALPSVRQVAAEYQLNPITVSRAYQELADEALVEKRRGCSPASASVSCVRNGRWSCNASSAWAC
jgi:GntR family transcriptional regulator